MLTFLSFSRLNSSTNYLLYGGFHIIQDQRRLGAIIVPNKEEVLLAAKKLSIVDVIASDLSKEKMTRLLYEELKKW